MLKAKKSAAVLSIINSLLATRSQTVSDPIEQLQEIVLEEYAPHIKAAKVPIPDKDQDPKAQSEFKSYADELLEVEQDPEQKSLN